MTTPERVLVIKVRHAILPNGGHETWEKNLDDLIDLIARMLWRGGDHVFLTTSGRTADLEITEIRRQADP